MYDDAGFERAEPLERGTTVACPYCGESVEIAVDPGGGQRQEYVEDCQVCCQPWSVVVTFDANGTLDVFVDGIQ